MVMVRRAPWPWGSPRMPAVPLGWGGDHPLRCEWSAFILDRDHATIRRSCSGHQSEQAVDVLSGLEDGENVQKVINWPPNELVDGWQPKSGPVPHCHFYLLSSNACRGYSGFLAIAPVVG